MNKCRYVRPNDRQILRGIEAGWPYEVCERGYDIFDFGNTGILGIEAIDDMALPFGDEDAAMNANETGFCKIIPVEELPEEFEEKYYVWVDTEENRKAIADYCKE